MRSRSGGTVPRTLGSDPLTDKPPRLLHGSRGTVAALAGGLVLLVVCATIMLGIVYKVLDDAQRDKDELRHQVEASNAKVDCVLKINTDANLVQVANGSAQNKVILGGFQRLDVSTYITELVESDRRMQETEARIAGIKAQCGLE